MRRSTAVLIVALALAAQGIPASAFKVKVVNSSGKPVPKAKVCMSIATGGEQQTKVVYTDKKGEFSYSPSSKSSEFWCTFTIVAKGCAYAEGYYNPKTLAPKTITLWPEQKLKGKIADENGKPVAGAKIVLQSFFAYNGPEANLNFRGRESVEGFRVTTKANGSFTLYHLPKPEDFRSVWVSIEVTADGRARICRSFDGQKLQGEAEITLPLECKLEGAVYLPDKAGTAPRGTGILVQLPSDPERGGTETRRATVEAEGRYRIDKLPPGKVNVVMQPSTPGQHGKQQAELTGNLVLPAVTGFELSPKQINTLDMTLVPGVLLKCTVVDKDTKKPFKLANIDVRHPGWPKGGPENCLGQYDADREKTQCSIYVAPGDIEIMALTVGDDATRATYFGPDEAPSMTLTVAPGEETKEVVFEIDRQDVAQMSYSVCEKPVSRGLELAPGTYQLEWDPNLNCQSYIRGRTAEAKSRISNLPKLASNTPLFYAYGFDGKDDDGLLLIVIDESEGAGKGYDTACIDVNRNRDMSDDQPVKLTTSGRSRSKTTDWVTVQAHQGPPEGERTDHPIRVRLLANSYGGGIYTYIERQGAWRGTIDSNKGKLQCTAVDMNANGAYSDRAQISDDLELQSGELDCICADVNEAGMVMVAPYGSQYLPLMEVAMLAGKPYEIRVSDIGDKITIAPYTGPMGKLLLTVSDVAGMAGIVTKMKVMGKQGFYTFDDCAGSPVVLPSGKYKVYECTLSLLTKTTSRAFTLDCRTDLVADVKDGEQAAPDINGKVTAAIDPERKEMALRPGRIETVNWVIKIGDKVTVSSMGRGDVGPRVKFFDKKGKLVRTMTAGYT